MLKKIYSADLKIKHLLSANLQPQIESIVKDIYAVCSFDYSDVRADVGDGERLVHDNDSPYRRQMLNEQEFKSIVEKIIISLDDLNQETLLNTLSKLKEYFYTTRQNKWIDEVIIKDLLLAAQTLRSPELFLDVLQIEKKYLKLIPRTEEKVVYLEVECVDNMGVFIDKDIRHEMLKKSIYSYYSAYCNSLEELKRSIALTKNFIENEPQQEVSLNTLDILFSKIKNFSLKCIVVDCDGTLWWGSADEDDLTNIKIDEDYRSFQKKLLQLKKQGVILAIISKNDEDRLFNVLDNHPDLILRRRDFVCIKANWQEKTDNLKEIAAELGGIGFDTFMFLDDSVVERHQMQATLPAVIVPELSFSVKERTEYLTKLNGRIKKQKQTKEAQTRSELYKHKEASDVFLKNAPDKEKALADLQIKVQIREAKRNDLNRVAELSIRTNRMRLNSQNFTVAELVKLKKTDGYKIFVLEAEDQLGSDGLVSAMIIKADKTNKNIHHLTNFFVSCRIAGKKIDDAFLSFVVTKLKPTLPHNKVSIIANYEEGPKNKSMFLFLENYGFIKNLPDQQLKFSGSPILPKIVKIIS